MELRTVTSAWYRALLLESFCQPYVLFVTEMSLYLPFPRLRSPASESPLQGILYSRSGRIPRTTPTAVCALSPHHILHKHQSRVCFQDLLVRPSLGVTALDRLLCLKEGPMELLGVSVCSYCYFWCRGGAEKCQAYSESVRQRPSPPSHLADVVEGAGEMAQQLRTLAALPEALDFITSTHTTANTCNSNSNPTPSSGL